MSESDGLRKLTEFLAQTRRQAEAAVDALNAQVADLKKDNEMCMQVVETLEAERDYFKNYAEQLKQENSTKYRLQERDDWKSLIDSVQRDRNRLQEDCISLENQLEQSKSEIEYMQEQLQRVSEEKAQLQLDAVGSSSGSSNSTAAAASPGGAGYRSPMPRLQLHSSGDDSADDQLTPTTAAAAMAAAEAQLSPVCDSSGCQMQLQGSSQSIARQLKLELKQAHSQMQFERRQSEADTAAHRMEIQRLQQQLAELSNNSSSISNSNSNNNGFVVSSSNGKHLSYNSTSSNGSSSDFDSRNISSSSSSRRQRPQHRTNNSNSGGSWLDPFGIVSFLFSSNSSSGNSTVDSSAVTILKV